jgi:hypothetical protein
LSAPLQQVSISHHRTNAHSIDELPPENLVMRVQYRKHMRSSEGSALRLDCPDASEKIFAVNLKTHSQVLGYFDALLTDELVEDPLDPLRSWTGPFHDSLLIQTNPIHYNNNSRVVHDPDHAGKDSLKPLA